MNVTVVQVAASMGVELDNSAAWTIGARVRDLWVAEHGELPVKDLRRKTNGPGSHCFALYPYDWIPTISRVIAEHVTESGRQFPLL